jgi:hypothetical protein
MTTDRFVQDADGVTVVPDPAMNTACSFNLAVGPHRDAVLQAADKLGLTVAHFSDTRFDVGVPTVDDMLNLAAATMWLLDPDGAARGVFHGRRP